LVKRGKACGIGFRIAAIQRLTTRIGGDQAATSPAVMLRM